MTVLSVTLQEICIVRPQFTCVSRYAQQRLGKLDLNVITPGLGQVHRLSTWVQVQVH